MAKKDFQYVGWNSYILQCGMRLWNHDSEFTKWQHAAMWYVALGWHAIEFAQTSPYWNSTSAFDFDHTTAVDMSFCTSLRNFIHCHQKKMTTCRFSRWQTSAILDFSGPIMGSLKSLCSTSYKSSTETIALNCLVFEKIAFFCILATDRRTDKQMDSTDALSRSRCRERRLNNIKKLKLIGGLK